MPTFPLSAWADTKHTLHLYLQIVGKIRLALMPPKNHWWHVPLYVSERGLTTRPMPTNPQHGRLLSIEFDFFDHRLRLSTSDGRGSGFPLTDGLSVRDFYRSVFQRLDELEVNADIQPQPFDHPDSTTPFADDTDHDAYNAEAVTDYWRILTRVDSILKRFSGRFLGKDSPVHVFWHTFDIAYTRFSGRPADVDPQADSGADPVTREAYSHEVVSFGFLAGDDSLPEPAFYSYTYPEPDDLTSHPLRPDAARWQSQESGSLALLTYADAHATGAFDDAVLDFLQSAYDAGSTAANWDRDRLDR